MPQRSPLTSLSPSSLIPHLPSAAVTDHHASSRPPAFPRPQLVSTSTASFVSVDWSRPFEPGDATVRRSSRSCLLHHRQSPSTSLCHNHRPPLAPLLRPRRPPPSTTSSTPTNTSRGAHLRPLRLHLPPSTTADLLRSRRLLRLRRALQLLNLPPSLRVLLDLETAADAPVIDYVDDDPPCLSNQMVDPWSQMPPPMNAAIWRPPTSRSS
ncbi:uncharacterized protein [Triticum aestivum]|uniref:uncharacterized protein isoform X1 n=1 Tax=Triticum aestivum TaxID=4565 RepID=UPI001D01D679|nr:uncharacterized protein LOC123069512 isoform X1 [Triticum aestivum]